MLCIIQDYLAKIGCIFPEINLLQPADPFLDTIGEDMRRRIFVTQENSGTLFCLRPEFTIPVGLHHLAGSGDAARYGYGGKVFRQRRNGASEFVQAGFEDLGTADKPTADIATIKNALGVLNACNIRDVSLVLGEESVFTDLLKELEIPQAWCKKLTRNFGDNSKLENHISQMANRSENFIHALPQSVADCLETANVERLVDVITDHMLADNLPLSGSRTPQAIAERLMERADLMRSSLEKDKRAILQAFLALDVPLDEAPAALAQFSCTYGLPMQGSHDALEALVKGLGNVAPQARYRASFGRRLDYYTGLVFEIFQKGGTNPVIGGGRYDRLMTLLGAPKEIPAIGFAVWVDRLGVDA